jgi:pilus assembly protein Flp/PilA
MMYLSAIRAQARNFLGKFVKNEQGVTAIEYAIVAAGVATVVFVVFKGNGPVATMLSDVFSTLKGKVTTTINAVSTAS